MLGLSNIEKGSGPAPNVSTPTHLSYIVLLFCWFQPAMTAVRFGTANRSMERSSVCTVPQVA
jgi:hypothetical protein